MEALSLETIQLIKTSFSELEAHIKGREDSKPKAQEKAWIRDLFLKEKLPNSQKGIVLVVMHYRYKKVRINITANKTGSFNDVDVLRAINSSNKLDLHYYFEGRTEIPNIENIFNQLNKHLS